MLLPAGIKLYTDTALSGNMGQSKRSSNITHITTPTPGGMTHLKSCLTPHGLFSGEIRYQGTLLSELSQREQAHQIGYVLQSPENQVVTDKVWHELAFGLESLGYDTPTIRRRVAEIAAFFGIENWFYKNVTELSGGQKQLLSLASVMAMQPGVLVLDEPTAQLDPIAAADFLALLGNEKVKREKKTKTAKTAWWAKAEKGNKVEQTNTDEATIFGDDAGGEQSKERVVLKRSRRNWKKWLAISGGAIVSLFVLIMAIGIVQARLLPIRLANQIPALPVAVVLAKLFL